MSRVALPVANEPALEEVLAARARPGLLSTRDEHGLLRCLACAHRCVVDRGRAGACAVRFERGGEILAPWGYVARTYVRAVETNTVHHVVPGAKALTFGGYGCDLRCAYCHNARLSQALRDGVRGEAPRDATPASIVEEAIAAGAEVLCAAYNEPMIAAEWMHDVFAEAKRRGLVTVVVSDGHTTDEALTFVRPVTDVFRVDLKGWLPEHYKALGGRVQPVFDAIRTAKRLGMWVEVVTLVVPGFNDDLAGLAGVAKTLAAIDRAMPWHLDAFQPRYRMTNLAPTDPVLLLQAAGSAYAKGLDFVYVGNVAGAVAELAHTRCPGCGETLVRRREWSTLENRLVGGRCPRCERAIPGVFAA